MRLSSTQTQLAHWVCLSQIAGIGSQTFYKLLQAFGEPEAIFATSYHALHQIVSQSIALEISQGPKLENAEVTLEWLSQANNHLLTLADPRYPKALLEIPDPPAILYCKGQLEALDRTSIAVVGSRNATLQGEKNAEEFSYALSQQGICIISGLALGIDGAAHRGALRGVGSTIAVVGTGLDIVYPARHRALAHQIVEQGLILSEYALGTPSRAQNFPRRNRLISGLSAGCLVIEANVQSGSLITARLAAEQGREVFAIPGSIHSPLSKGCHQLIKQGAKLVDCIQDITDELGLLDTSANKASMDDSDESAGDTAHPTHQHLLHVMAFDPISMDALVERSGLTSEQLSAILLMLELEGKITSLPGGRYQQIA